LKNQLLLIAIFIIVSSCQDKQDNSCKSENSKFRVRGWSIQTNWEAQIDVVLDATKDYDINHFQLLSDIIMNLKDVKDPVKQELVNRTIKKAHEKGIREVVVWDHALYNLDYYPAQFRISPDGLINLDNPEFWDWLKQDYKSMLALLPEVDGIVLTFIETGARAELQYSEKLLTPAEKLAAVINAIADVVIDENGKSLYIRTFAYDKGEYENITSSIDLIKSDQVILMMKETPHDFYLTHPNLELVGKINRPTIVEFDCGNEYNGQNIVANTWPEYIERRWKDFMQRPNVIGYVARVDRFKSSICIGTPNEIQVYALDCFTKDSNLTADDVYDKFIGWKYGEKAIPFLKPAFKMAYDINTSIFYTLGLNTTNHSRLDYDYRSIYTRQVSEKWKEDKMIYVAHGVNKCFHAYKDMINHISPAEYKSVNFRHNKKEMGEIFEENWLEDKEKMNEEYLEYIVAEKKYGSILADSALSMIKNAEKFVTDNKAFDNVFNCFERTSLTAHIRASTAKVYYASRISSRGKEFKTDYINRILEEGMEEMSVDAEKIENYSKTVPIGQWDWKSDVMVAERYRRAVMEEKSELFRNIIFKKEN